MPKERPSCAAALVQVSGMRQNENIVNLSVLRTRTAVTSARATYRAATHLPDNQRTCERGILQAGSGRLLAVPQLDCLLAIGRDTFKASSALRDEPQLSTSKWATTGDCAASVSRHIQGSVGRRTSFGRNPGGRSCRHSRAQIYRIGRRRLPRSRRRDNYLRQHAIIIRRRRRRRRRRRCRHRRR